MTEAISGIQGSTRGVREQESARPAHARTRPAARPQPVLRSGAEHAHRRREERRAELHGAAGLLHAMIEQMGGSETSLTRGSFVSLTV